MWVLKTGEWLAQGLPVLEWVQGQPLQIYETLPQNEMYEEGLKCSPVVEHLPRTREILGLIQAPQNIIEIK